MSIEPVKVLGSFNRGPMFAAPCALEATLNVVLP